MYEYQINQILCFAMGQKFNGVFARDRLPLRRKNGGYIINFDLFSQPGSHWVAVYVHGDLVEYFDPFGRAPHHTEILFFLGNNFTFNSVQLQPIFSKYCGHYCIYYLIQRHYNNSSNSIVKILQRSDSLFIVKQYTTGNFKPLLYSSP